MKNCHLPSAFLEKMKHFFTSEDEFHQFKDSCLRPLRKSIRINTLKISVQDFESHAQKKNWRLTSIPWCREGFWIDRPDEEQKSVPLGKTWEHVLGLFYIQEASSMLPPVALFHSVGTQNFASSENLEESKVESQKSESLESGVGSEEKESGNNLKFKIQNLKLLDMAAAPGSKTTQLAAQMGNSGLIVANEFSASRIKKLYSNLERSGVSNVILTNVDGEKFARFTPGTFDAILLDAPCTGEGTIRKDRDALRNWSERKIQIAAGVQKNLIVAAFEALKPGGVLVYSTCTLAPEENEEVCCFLWEKFGGEVEFQNLSELFPEAEKCVTKEGFLKIWPHVFDTEGFFVALIRKKGNSLDGEPKHISSKQKNRKFPFSQIGKSKFELLKTYYSEHFGFQFSFLKDRVWEREREIWLFPEGTQELIEKMRLDRMGIKLCEVHEKGIKTLHEMAVVFGTEFSQNVVDLNSEQAMEFYAGRDLVSQELKVESKKNEEELIGNEQLAMSNGNNYGLRITNEQNDSRSTIYDKNKFIRNSGNSATGEVLLRFHGFPLGIGKMQKGEVKNKLPREVVKEGVEF